MAAATAQGRGRRPTAPRHTTVSGSGGVELAVWESGPQEAPTVLLVHGYPDCHSVWDLVAERLAGEFRVVTYDVRGAGASDIPPNVADYRIENLVGDLAAVVTAVGGPRVHLVGHDWGSIQCWSAVTEPTVAPALASFTSLSAPGLAHIDAWLGEQLRIGSGSWRDLATQAMRSWYIAAFQVPFAPLVWRHLLAARWRGLLERSESVACDERWPAPTLLSDAEHGINLYRANLAPLAERPSPVVSEVPVQLLVARRDSYVTPPLVEFPARYVRELRRTELDCGHWAPRSEPALVASAVAAFVKDVEAGLPVNA